jgi:twitching motility protein PilT
MLRDMGASGNGLATNGPNALLEIPSSRHYIYMLPRQAVMTNANPLDETCPTEIRNWLTAAIEAEASDLHVVPGYPPTLRVHGELRQCDAAALEAGTVRELLVRLCPAYAMGRFRAARNVDFALELTLRGRVERFRVNYFLSDEQLGACFRVIPSAIPDFQWAGFPEDLAHRLAHYRNGLVLICGVVGSGKSTTLAMLINQLNQEEGYRIITIEEPVEYLFPKTPVSVVTQREVGRDVLTFADGLKYALRQDPDVILAGEIRDRETAQMALSAAETGHLVLSTLHTRDAKGAISRYADLFPQSVQQEVRSQLALSLRAVVSQHLLPNVKKEAKRVLALEIMFNTPAVGAAIRFSKLESIDTVILTSRAEGMRTLDESIKQLLKEGRISRKTAERFISTGTKL